MSEDRGRPDRLITLKDVPSMVGVSRNTLFAWMERRQFPRGLQLSLRTRRWWRGEVLEWLATRELERNESKGP